MLLFMPQKLLPIVITKFSKQIKNCVTGALNGITEHQDHENRSHASKLEMGCWFQKLTSHSCTLWIKSTDALNSSFIGITTLHVSGSLSAHQQEFLAVHRLWYILCSCDRLLPGVGFHPTSGSKWLQLHKMYQSRCTAKNSWWWAERLPETCRVVIPIKLEFSASVGFIHKEFVTMHGHRIVKKNWFLHLCKILWAFASRSTFSSFTKLILHWGLYSSCMLHSLSW